jgi:hypothetical protein
MKKFLLGFLSFCDFLYLLCFCSFRTFRRRDYIDPRRLVMMMLFVCSFGVLNLFYCEVFSDDSFGLGFIYGLVFSAWFFCVILPFRISLFMFFFYPAFFFIYIWLIDCSCMLFRFLGVI